VQACHRPMGARLRVPEKREQRPGWFVRDPAASIAGGTQSAFGRLVASARSSPARHGLRLRGAGQARDPSGPPVSRGGPIIQGQERAVWLLGRARCRRTSPARSGQARRGYEDLFPAPAAAAAIQRPSAAASRARRGRGVGLCQLNSPQPGFQSSNHARVASYQRPNSDRGKVVRLAKRCSQK